eukprot:PhF_6_TR9163/c0_g1_i1/m.14249/K00762/pyrE; orotate phosphoribosyltransferase
MSEDLIAFAKQSFRFNPIDELIAKDTEAATLHRRVRAAIVRNVKMGPFTTTAGVVLPYLLNASTNLMDKHAAGDIVALYGKVLPVLAQTAGIKPDEKFIVVGMETAGGMLACQLAVAAPASLPLTDYVYMRKKKKESGTGQQLEATGEFTSRTSTSAPIKAIWVDDANSTGSSLLEGIDTLAKDYNITVVGALYLVDRSVDRQGLPVERQKMATDVIRGKVTVAAVYDLSEIDAELTKPAL